jgi:Kef-type K+ transport system membrane component KefB
VRLPRVVGEMTAGLILGQSLLGHVWPHAESLLFGHRVLVVLKPLALVVVLLYLALVGAQLDLRALAGRTRGLAGGVAVGLAAAAGGAAVVRWALPELRPTGVDDWAYLVFVACALLVSAVPVLARILDEAGLAATRVGNVTLALSIADDCIAFSAVAVTIAVVAHDEWWRALAGVALLVSLFVSARPVRGLLRQRPGATAVGAVAVGGLAVVAGTIDSLAGTMLLAACVVGALAWRPRELGGSVPYARAIRTAVPLYIAYAGLSVDAGRLAHPRLLVAIVVATLLAVGTKALASFAAGRFLAFGRGESVSMVVLRNTRGLTELVVLNLGYQAGLLSHDLYTVFFAMALITTAASGVLAMTALPALQRSAGAPGRTAVVASR